MKNPVILPVILMAAALTLAACEGVEIDPDAKTPSEQREERLSTQGSFLTGRREGGFSLGQNFGGSGAVVAPVNALLWRASLDTISVIPISSVDTFSGTIISDWYPHPEYPDRSIKAAVFIVGSELRSDAVQVEIYVRRRDVRGEWIDLGRDTSLATRLEDLILTRAREIRASGLGESDS